MNHYRKLIMTVLTALSFLTACGGGGGSDPDPTPEPPAPVETNAQVSGKAVKGVIANGVVSVYGVENGVKQTTPLVTGSTAADGSYSVTVTGYEGPLIVEITPGTSA